MKYYVLLMRDAELLRTDDSFESLQDLQYIAGPIEAKDEQEAAKLAKRELRKADLKDNLDCSAEVLGYIRKGEYYRWFNGDFR